MNNESVNFDRAAGYYDETRGFPPGVEKDVAKVIAKAGSLDKNSRILELGIGTGRIALPLSAEVSAVFGVDISSQMMGVLQSKITTERIYLTRGSALTLPFPANTFDAVMTVHVLHLVPDFQGLLTEVKRVLKPSAPLLNGWNHNGERWFWHITHAIYDDAEAEKYIVGIPTPLQHERLQEVGWKPRADMVIHEFKRFRTPRDVLQRAQTRTWSQLWTLSDEELTDVLKTMESKFLEKFGDLDTEVDLQASFRVGAYFPPEG